MNQLEKEKLDGLFADPENKKLIFAFADSRVTQALITASKKSLSVNGAYERLQRLEKAADKKIASLELKNQVIKKAFQKGINPEIIDALELNFKDEGEIENKLSKLAGEIKIKNELDINEKLVMESFKPSGGRSIDSGYSLKNDLYNKLSPEERNALHLFE